MSFWRRRDPDGVGPGSVSAETVSGIVSTGAGAVNVQFRAEQLTAPEAVAAPAGLVHLPGRPQVFVGRDRELRRLDAAFDAPGSVVVQAVHGLGGIGKSTLAARWADQRRETFFPVWWITADSAEALDAGLVAFAVGLQPGAETVLPSAVLRERAVQWLASHQGWLLILDDVTEPADITGLLARLPQGRIVVTSRRATGWPDTVTPIRLDVLEQAEAVALLTGKLTRAGRRIDEGDAAAVCAELGGLPLAVEQAAAYLAQTGLPARDYLRLLGDQPDRMLGEGEEGRRVERTVARVWKVTLDALADDPGPGLVLRVLAWLGPEDVPRALLYGVGDEATVAAALGRLAAYNMIDVDDATVSTHRLVQAVARTPDPADPNRRPADIAAAHTFANAALILAAPDDWKLPASWPQWRSLAPHLEAAIASTVLDELPDVIRRVRADVLNGAGLFSAGQGNTAAAVRFHQQARTDRRRLLGDDHPSTLVSVNNLASALQAAGDYRQAIPMYEKTLADCRRVLGEDHPNTLASINLLASGYAAAGDPVRALPLYEQALAGRRRVLGDDHPSTLASVNNLAFAFQAAGDLRRAVPMYEKAATDCRRVLGEDHPDTLSALNNLAGAYRALPLQEEVLDDRRRVLGEEHPDTLTTMNNLAGAYRAAGHLDRAIPLYEETLAVQRRVLGEDHPHTLSTTNNLAFARGAIPLYERSLAGRRRVLGENHPDTADTEYALARAYEAAGDPGRAAPLYEQSLATRRRVLGENHPDTVDAAHALAGVYVATGDAGRALPLYEHTLAQARRVLGEDHPVTAKFAEDLRNAAGSGPSG